MIVSSKFERTTYTEKDMEKVHAMKKLMYWTSYLNYTLICQFSLHLTLKVKI